MERMKFTLIFITALSLGLATSSLIAQDAVNPNKATSAVEEGHDAKEGQDKEFYEYYYKTIAESQPLKKAKLEYNLIKALKKEIVSRDTTKEAKENIKKIDTSNIKYEKVYRESKWVRGFMGQLPHLTARDFMFVVKYDKYMCFVSFDVNPESYLQEARQSQLIFEGKDKFEISIPKP
ncbi:hypothetical protein [Leptospira ilyithenensis]|uniref:Uncharacterized protein n=1 Tax=Leptospira ilyithenensis TaxID=2484901 RepID=A0A4R9LWM8_9LEPT|nr:hypothetical protein [Leptospira ilyithenensis]TGN14542.1 hypothetical protein EHS11_00685 [Leptospira ilyithenensis]